MFLIENCCAERLRASGSSAASERNKEMGNPFVHTVHGNPTFTPGKSGKPTVRLLLGQLYNSCLVSNARTKRKIFSKIYVLGGVSSTKAS